MDEKLIDRFEEMYRDTVILGYHHPKMLDRAAYMFTKQIESESDLTPPVELFELDGNMLVRTNE